jgi:hypothetical protein
MFTENCYGVTVFLPAHFGLAVVASTIRHAALPVDIAATP